MERCDDLWLEHNGIIGDFSRQRVTTKTVKVNCQDKSLRLNYSCSLGDNFSISRVLSTRLNCTLQLLRKLAEAANLKAKISHMFAGEHINVTEDRAVLHPALRAPRDEVIAEQPKLHLLCVLT